MKLTTKKAIRKKVLSFIRLFLPWLIVFTKVLALGYSRRSFFRQSGYIKSTILKRPCKKDGSPIPWMNYAVIDFLEERLAGDLTLLEYGSGNSTLFYAARTNHITSVEEDEKWYNFFVPQLPQNATLILCAPYLPEKYVTPEEIRGKRFDVIVIDGADRNLCLYRAIDYLSERGVVILDDTQGDVTKPGIDFLISQGFKKIDFSGLKPGGIRMYRTSIIYREKNCLNI
jgi:hypothetical protein